MAKSSDNSSSKPESVKIHEGRLRVLLQTLKDKKTEITINLDITGEKRKTVYGYTNKAEHTWNCYKKMDTELRVIMQLDSVVGFVQMTN